MNGEYFVAAADLQDIADAIRAKRSSGPISYPFGFISAISAIHTEPVMQSKTVSPFESDQTIYPDSGYDGLGTVMLEAIPSDYIGSGIARMVPSTYVPGSMNMMISSGTYLLGDLTIAGDPNLRPENIASGQSIFGVVGTVECGPDSYFKMAIEGNANNEMLRMCSSASRIGPYAFANAADIQKVSLPNCSTVEAYAFSGCEYLTRVSLPSCTNIGAGAFAGCSTLSSVYVPMVSQIRQYAFSNCKSLVSISIPNCRTIIGYAFAYAGLKEISIPNNCTIWYRAFANSPLETVYFPRNYEPGYLYMSAFEACELKNLYLYEFSRLYSRGTTFYTYFRYTPLYNGNGTIYVNPNAIDYLKTTDPYSIFASQYAAWNL